MITERIKDRIKTLLKEPVLFQEAENITVNAPVAIHQIAFQNELNGILLGIGMPELRVLRLPMAAARLKQIFKIIERL